MTPELVIEIHYTEQVSRVAHCGCIYNNSGIRIVWCSRCAQRNDAPDGVTREH